MPHITVFAYGPWELVGALFSLPLFSMVLAAIVAAVLIIALRRPGVRRRGSQAAQATAQAVARTYRPERRSLGIVAFGVIVVFAGENLVRGYALNVGAVVPWWRYATPLVAAIAGLAVVLGLVIARGTKRSEVPIFPTSRRTWLTSSSRMGIVAAGVVLFLLVATTVATGMASSTDRNGRYVWLIIPVPNEAGIDPIRLPFYGWAYGVPVLVCLLALAAITWAVLRSNAVRPYIRPETVAAEQDARREIAGGTVRVATAGMLLALAGAWRLISGTGTVAHLTIGGQNGGSPYDVAWRYADLATVAGWAAPLLEITAFVLLFLVAGRTGGALAPSPEPSPANTDLEVAL